MKTKIRVLVFFLLSLGWLDFIKHVYAAESSNTDTAMLVFISKRCPCVSIAAIQASLIAYHKARKKGLDKKNILTIVDFSKSDTKRRFCTIDLNVPNVLFNEFVEHGAKSGDEFATRFSNALNSHESSLGLYLTGEPYNGVAGYSLILHGLDKGLNDNADIRHVVLHAAHHLMQERHHSKKGHTYGCFAINKEDIQEVIHHLRGGTLLFAYYPAAGLLKKSIFLSNNE